MATGVTELSALRTATIDSVYGFVEYFGKL